MHRPPRGQASMPPQQPDERYEVEYIRYGIVKSVATRSGRSSRLEWRFAVKWSRYELHEDEDVYPSHCFLDPATLPEFHSHVHSSCVKPQYLEGDMIFPVQSYRDKRILETFWASRQEDEFPMEPEDLQWLWEKLAGRTDFRHLGQASWQDERVRDWSLIHPENSVPGSRSRHPPVAAPLHTVSSNEVSFHDLEDLMAALFAVQADFDDLQTNVSLGEVDGTMVDDVSPRPLRPQDIADDGWPKWMKRIDFSQSDKSPFKILTETIGADDEMRKQLRSMSRRWRSAAQRVCSIRVLTDASAQRFGGFEKIPDDYEEPADTSTECGHFFAAPNLKANFAEGRKICPQCNHLMRYCPFPGAYLKNPKRTPQLFKMPSKDDEDNDLGVDVKPHNKKPRRRGGRGRVNGNTPRWNWSNEKKT